MEVKIISGYGENTFQMDDADTMSLLNNAMRFHNKIKAIDGVEDNTGIKAEKEEEIKESITAQEFVKRMQEKPHSRNDSLFGTGWKKEPEKTEEPQDMEHPDGYKGFVIKCGDGTGIVHAGSYYACAVYGKLDTDGCIAEPYGYIYLTDNGFIYEE